MKMHAVDSSAIASYGYDEATRDLVVQYKGGGAYTYHDVSPATVEGLGKAGSVGKFMNEHVKGSHRVRKHGGAE